MIQGRAKFFGGAALLMGAAVFGAAPAGPAGDTGAAHLAGLLVNDAHETLRDVTIDPASAAKQATVLLQFAAKLDPSDLHTQRLIAQTAGAAGETDVQKDALRRVIAGERGDLVSQVRYIDLLASAAQSLDDRAKVFRGALDQAALDPQIRSEMAVRLAAIAEKRQDLAEAKQFFTTALQLNDVNMAALRGMVRVAAGEGNLPANQVAHLKALAALLVANPLQPDAWKQAGRLCALAGLHDRAAEFFRTAAAQEQIDGTWPEFELAQALAVEEALAGQFKEAQAEAQAVAGVPGAPLEPLLVAQLVMEETAVASQPMAAATQSDSAKNASEIRSRLAAMVSAAKGDDRAAALADAAGIAWTVLGGNAPEAAAWTDEYATLVAADDPTLARLRGWQLYRQGKLENAAAALEKIAATDPLAQVGLARIYIEQKNTAKAADLLQDVWGTHPSALLALQVVRTARMAGIKLTEGNWTQQMRTAAGALTPAVMTMHGNMADSVLMTANYKKNAVAYGDPVTLSVRMNNTTERVLPVGDNGVMKTSVGLAAVGPGADAALGLYAVEDLQRVYRILPHQYVDATMRVDQAELADVLVNSPSKPQRVTVWAVSAPRVISGMAFSNGVGGQGIAVGDFLVTGFSWATPTDVEAFLKDMNAAIGAKKLVRIDAAGAFLRQMSDAKSDAGALPQQVKDEVAAAYGALAKSADSLVRAEYVQGLPVDKTDNVANHDVKSLADDPDPLVRLMLLRYGAFVVRGLPDEAGMKTAMEKRLDGESDPLVKAWMEAAIANANADVAATQPAAATGESDGH